MELLDDEDLVPDLLHVEPFENIPNDYQLIQHEPLEVNEMNELGI